MGSGLLGSRLIVRDWLGDGLNGRASDDWSIGTLLQVSSRPRNIREGLTSISSKFMNCGAGDGAAYASPARAATRQTERILKRLTEVGDKVDKVGSRV